MRHLLWVFLALLGSYFASHPEAYSRERAVPPQQSRLKILECHDGDTCRARSPEGFVLKLRLIGIDAPEVGGRGKKGQRYGEEAKQALNARVKGKELQAQLLGHDVYQRYLTILRDEQGGNINEALLREGYAFAYERSPSSVKAWAKPAEAEARKKARGFWSLPPQEQPQNPRDFRKRKR